MKRIYFIDWLRIIAILVVFVFHNSHFFDPLYWHVKNAHQSESVSVFLGFVNLWIMPLFFLLSGAAGVFGINKSFAKYTAGKATRLLVPYIVGVLFLIPPQKYLEVVTHQHYTQNYFHYLGEYFSGGIFNYPIGFCPLWIGALAYHLWFLGHLAVISVVLYPLLRYLANKGQGLITWIYNHLSLCGGLILLFIPVAIIRILLKKSYPYYTNWADLAIYTAYFLYGFILTKHEGFRAYLVRDIWPAAITANIGTAVYFFSFGFKGTFFHELFQNSDIYSYYMVQETMAALTTWSWLVLIMGLGVHYLDKDSPKRAELNEAVLPFYILHQTVILIVGYFVVQWDWNNWEKFAVITTGSLFIIIIVYLFAIRPFKVMRYLFGMNIKQGKIKN